MIEKEHWLKTFLETKKAIEKQDLIKLKILSNQTIHSASINQDAESITIAVIIYAIGKILERNDYRQKPEWNKFYRNLLLEIDIIIDSLKKDNLKKFSLTLEKLRKNTGKISGKMRRYIEEVLHKASINKASRIYEHGISLEKTAKLLGITLWELSNYAGQTGIADVKLGKTLNIKNRIKLALEMFK